jgi:phosphoribosylformylglycinamidine synthase
MRSRRPGPTAARAASGLTYDPKPRAFTGLDAAGLADLGERMKLNLSKDEISAVQGYFRAEGREPTDTELQAVAQAWSEHCCYKSSKVHLRDHLFGLTSPDLVAKGDAGVMRFDDEFCYALRIESHNHPSALEPYGGAATGIGGILRDVLAMGAQPIALVDPLFFGPLDLPNGEVPDGSLHPRFLFSGVVAGIRDYGNRVGIPTVAGSVVFDRRYTGNCLVNVGCVGVVRNEEVQRNAAGGVGHLFLLCGGRTGRDGIHGVTFASAVLHEGSRQERSAVQLGDPITKEPLIHAVREAVERKLVSGIKDLGGGGLSCVVGEMALAAGLGAEVELDRVPLKEEGMEPWEVWVSESQERMMLSVPPHNLAAVKEIFDSWDVEASAVGHATEGDRCVVRWRGEVVVDLDLEFYTKGPELRRPVRERLYPTSTWRKPVLPTSQREILLSLLADQNVCSREWIVRMYDHEVRGATLLKPFTGTRATGPSDAVVLRPRPDSPRGLALAIATQPRAADVDPYEGARLVVDEAARSLAACGARIHAATDNLNFGNPEDPERMWEFRETCRGLGDACAALGVPMPSGNVSLYNQHGGEPVIGTAVLLATGIVEDAGKAVSTDLKRDDSTVLLIGPRARGMGGSLLYRKWGGFDPVVPASDPGRLRKYCQRVAEAAAGGLFLACHDVSDGGLLVALAEMCIGGDVGARVVTRLGETDAFGEAPTRWLVEVERGREKDAFRAFRGLEISRVAETGGDLLRSGESNVPLREMEDAFRGTLGRLVG